MTQPPFWTWHECANGSIRRYPRSICSLCLPNEGKDISVVDDEVEEMSKWGGHEDNEAMNIPNVGELAGCIIIFKNIILLLCLIAILATIIIILKVDCIGL